MVQALYYISSIKESKYKDTIIEVISQFFYSKKLAEYQIICALCDAEVLGFVIFENKNDICILHYTYILPLYRNQNVAKNLLCKLYEVNKPLCKYIVNMLVYDNEKYGIENFWYALGFNTIAIDCLGYFIKKEDWVMGVEPRLKSFSRNNPYSMVDYQEISNTKKTQIAQYINLQSIPEHFSPVLSMEDNKGCKCYFDKNEQLIGWTIINQKNKYTIEFCCTYIVETHRNINALCSIWKMISIEIKLKNPNIKYLIFYYDVNSIKLRKLYFFFLKQCACKHFKRIVLQHEISFL
ncbi:hypothetical protein PRBRB14_04330 [Hallella multisaccharivorax DSM 17128]|uniref:GCN5-related N-acetyltransferase n=1 Tax=Hallella multisaccharivorax DSM 17128 TaxID=688246 RepID=F8NCG7_9BACT|nr:GNAT family N-acetyltransferase [Hallella multisaccharivorax]EGN56057.1 hypothetical protein Premu_0580 [Hallella multisaccharivorax DSM 17128]GJG29554.1 hypothetical protein PRBRB14_04330 [Hallella multisaccharivorax DSM 17128]